MRWTTTVVEQLTEVNGTLAFGPPKTAAGRRRVSLPAFPRGFLKGHLAKHAESGPSGLTLGRYGHLLPAQAEVIAARLEAAFHSAHATSVRER